MSAKKLQSGSVLIAVAVFVFVVTSLFAGVTLVKQNQNSEEKAAGGCTKNPKQCKASEECISGVCKPRPGGAKDPVENAPGDSKASCKGVWCGGCGGFCITGTSQTCNQAAQIKCGETASYSAECTSANEGQVVVYSSDTNDYRKCVNGRWEKGYKITDLTSESVPIYLQSDYDNALEAKLEAEEKAEAEALAKKQADEKRLRVVRQPNDTTTTQNTNTCTPNSTNECEEGSECELMFPVTNVWMCVKKGTFKSKIGESCTQNSDCQSNNCQVVPGAKLCVEAGTTTEKIADGLRQTAPTPVSKSAFGYTFTVPSFKSSAECYSYYSDNPSATMFVDCNSFATDEEKKPSIIENPSYYFNSNNQPALPDNFNPSLSGLSVSGGQSATLPVEVCDKNDPKCLDDVVTGTKAGNTTGLVAYAGAVGAVTSGGMTGLLYAGTTYQTIRAGDVCSANPESKQCIEELGYTALSFANIGTVKNVLGLAPKAATYLNRGVNAANVITDFYVVGQSCGDGEYASDLGCTVAVGATLLDFGGSAIDETRLITKPKVQIDPVTPQISDDLADVFDVIAPLQTNITATIDLNPVKNTVQQVTRATNENVDSLSFVPQLLRDTPANSADYGFPTRLSDFDMTPSKPLIPNPEQGGGLAIRLTNDTNTVTLDNLGTISLPNLKTVEVPSVLKPADELAEYLFQPLTPTGNNYLLVGAPTQSFNAPMALDPKSDVIPPPKWYQDLANTITGKTGDAPTVISLADDGKFYDNLGNLYQEPQSPITKLWDDVFNSPPDLPTVTGPRVVDVNGNFPESTQITWRGFRNDSGDFQFPIISKPTKISPDESGEFSRLSIIRNYYAKDDFSFITKIVDANADVVSDVNIATNPFNLNVKVKIDDEVIKLRPGESMSYYGLTFDYKGLDKDGLPILEYRNPYPTIQDEPTPLAFDKSLTDEQVKNNIQKMQPGGKYRPAWTGSVFADDYTYVIIDVDPNGNILSFDDTSYGFRRSLIFENSTKKAVTIEIETLLTPDYYGPKYRYRIVTTTSMDELPDIAQEALSRTIDEMNRTMASFPIDPNIIAPTTPQSPITKLLKDWVFGPIERLFSGSTTPPTGGWRIFETDTNLTLIDNTSPKGPKDPNATILDTGNTITDNPKTLIEQDVVSTQKLPEAGDTGFIKSGLLKPTKNEYSADDVEKLINEYKSGNLQFNPVNITLYNGKYYVVDGLGNNEFDDTAITKALIKNGASSVPYKYVPFDDLPTETKNIIKLANTSNLSNKLPESFIDSSFKPSVSSTSITTSGNGSIIVKNVFRYGTALGAGSVAGLTIANIIKANWDQIIEFFDGEDKISDPKITPQISNQDAITTPTQSDFGEILLTPTVTNEVKEVKKYQLPFDRINPYRYPDQESSNEELRKLAESYSEIIIKCQENNANIAGEDLKQCFCSNVVGGCNSDFPNSPAVKISQSLADNGLSDRAYVCSYLEGMTTSFCNCNPDETNNSYLNGQNCLPINQDSKYDSSKVYNYSWCPITDTKGFPFPDALLFDPGDIVVYNENYQSNGDNGNLAICNEVIDNGAQCTVSQSTNGIISTANINADKNTIQGVWRRRNDYDNEGSCFTYRSSIP